jgi:hypothetical protein
MTGLSLDGAAPTAPAKAQVHSPAVGVGPSGCSTSRARTDLPQAARPTLPQTTRARCKMLCHPPPPFQPAGFCGVMATHCGAGCQPAFGSCSGSAPQITQPQAPQQVPVQQPSGRGVGGLISAQQWESMFPTRNNPPCKWKIRSRTTLSTSTFKAELNFRTATVC